MVNWFKVTISTLCRTVAIIYGLNFPMVLIRDVMMIGIVALEIMQIQLGGKFIDATADVLSNYEQIGFQEYLYTESFQYLAFILLLVIFIRILTNVKDYISLKIQAIMEYLPKYWLLKKLMSENLEEIETQEFQNLITFVNNFSFARFYATYEKFSDMVQQIIRTVAFSILLYSFVGNWTIILILMSLPEAFFSFLKNYNIKKLRQSGVTGFKYLDYIYNLAADISNFIELRVNSTFNFLKESYYKENEKWEKVVTHKYKHFMIDNALVSIGAYVGFSIYRIFLIFIGVARGFTIGSLTVLFSYAEACFNAAYLAFDYLFQLLDNLSYMDNYFELMDYSGFGDKDAGKKKLPKGAPSLEFMQIDFEYPGHESKILENLSFNLGAGDNIALIGGDSSGKSTIVKILCGLYRITAGDYLIGGLSVRELARSELKSRIAITSQNFVNYSFTIRENITIGSHRENLNHELYEKAKRVSGVDEFMKRVKVKDDQLLGKYFPGGREISPAFWQRLAIARMIYRDRDIFILDEPFSFIDPEAGEKILDALIKYTGRDKILILVSQDDQFAWKFDQTLYLKKGKVSGFKQH